MDALFFTVLVLMFGSIMVYVIGSTFWVTVIEPLVMRWDFHRTFGHEPTSDAHLKKPMQAQVVDPVLTQLARDLYKHNREEAKLLRRVKENRIPFAEAKTKLPQARGAAKAYYRRFKKVRHLA